MVVSKNNIQQKIYNSVVRIINNSNKVNLLIPYQSVNHSKSQGAGFFFDRKGHILTAAHVIIDSTELWINIPDEGKKNYKAEIITIYPDFDLAIIKINNYKNKHFLTLGNSDRLQIRDMVHTIGYPNNANNPIVTSGTISGTRDDYIQTDTPINPGNSGGPLLNEQNHVIGITSAVIRKSENSSLIIPINIAKNNIEAMLSSKSRIIYKNALGVILINGTTNYHKLNNNHSNSGVIIKKILNSSPLYGKASEGDIICGIHNGKNLYMIDNYGEISVEWEMGKVSVDYIIKRCVPNQNIKLIIWNIKTKSMYTKQLKLKTFENVYPVLKIYPPITKIDYEIIGGMILMELSINHLLLPQFKKIKYILYNDDIYKKHLVITHIFPSSQLSNYNIIEPYSILKSINGNNVNDLKSFRKEIKKSFKNSKSRSVKNQYMTITTKENDSVVLNIQDIKREDEILSKQYKYNSSDMIRLIKAN